MEWQIVKIKDKSTEKIPFVKVSRDQLFFDERACELIHDAGQYKYVQFMKAQRNEKEIIAVRFLCFYDENVIDITREKQNGNSMAGITVNCADIIDALFGAVVSDNDFVQYNVERFGNDMLIIDC